MFFGNGEISSLVFQNLRLKNDIQIKPFIGWRLALR